jgi:hypothetical protein
VVATHYTTAGHAASIREHGARISRSARGLFGQGFYAVVGGGGQGFGAVLVRVAIRMRNPLEGDGATVARRIREISGRAAWGTPADRRAVREALVRAGYDGIIIRGRNPRLGTWVVGLVTSNIRVVVEG